MKKTPDDFDDILSFLSNNGIKTELVNVDKYGFSREIEFTIYETYYIIEWYKNQSTLKIGSHKRPAQIPFRYMYLDNTFPLVDGNRSIGFAYTRSDKVSAFDRMYPFEVFRIPLELNKG